MLLHMQYLPPKTNLPLKSIKTIEHILQLRINAVNDLLLAIIHDHASLHYHANEN